MIRAALLACLLLTSGCTALQAAQYATARYCGIPAEVRAANRAAVGLAVSPNRIAIECAQ